MEELTNKENRTVTLRFRVTAAEKKQIKSRAQMAVLILSDYLRTAALGKPQGGSTPVPGEPLTGEQRQALLGITTDLHKAMHLANLDQQATDELIQIISKIKSLLL